MDRTQGLPRELGLLKMKRKEVSLLEYPASEVENEIEVQIRDATKVDVGRLQGRACSLVTPAKDDR